MSALPPKADIGRAQRDVRFERDRSPALDPRHRSGTRIKKTKAKLAQRSENRHMDPPAPPKTEIENAARQEEELIAEKRRRIEEQLWAIHEADVGDYFDSHEVDGKVIERPAF